MCRLGVAAVGARYPGSDEKLAASCPVADCQSDSAIFVSPLNRPTFPPVPLVYSYTHPGLYKWTLQKDGSVKLELVDDPTLCTIGTK